jgi:hypothetical protein
LVALWRKNLPAGAAMVLFEDIAVLSSLSTRTRTHRQSEWTWPKATIMVSVSWKPANHLLGVHLWQVSPDYTKLRDWAAFATFEDLLGWAVYYGKACLIDGAMRSSIWPKAFAAFFCSSIPHERLISDLQSETLPYTPVFFAVTSSNEDYNAAVEKYLSLLLDPSSRSNLYSLCIIDCSEHNAVVSRLINEIEIRK